VSVAIVGAGPGDPGLVTVRALEHVRASPGLV
jgi:siroheme synthase